MSFRRGTTLRSRTTTSQGFRCAPRTGDSGTLFTGDPVGTDRRASPTRTITRQRSLPKVSPSLCDTFGITDDELSRKVVVRFEERRRQELLTTLMRSSGLYFAMALLFLMTVQFGTYVLKWMNPFSSGDSNGSWLLPNLLTALYTSSVFTVIHAYRMFNFEVAEDIWTKNNTASLSGDGKRKSVFAVVWRWLCSLSIARPKRWAECFAIHVTLMHVVNSTSTLTPPTITSGGSISLKTTTRDSVALLLEHQVFNRLTLLFIVIFIDARYLRNGNAIKFPYNQCAMSNYLWEKSVAIFLQSGAIVFGFVAVSFTTLLLVAKLKLPQMVPFLSPAFWSVFPSALLNTAWGLSADEFYISALYTSELAKVVLLNVRMSTSTVLSLWLLSESICQRMLSEVPFSLGPIMSRQRSGSQRPLLHGVRQLSERHVALAYTRRMSRKSMQCFNEDLPSRRAPRHRPMSATTVSYARYLGLFDLKRAVCSSAAERNVIFRDEMQVSFVFGVCVSHINQWAQHLYQYMTAASGGGAPSLLRRRGSRVSLTPFEVYFERCLIVAPKLNALFSESNVWFVANYCDVLSLLCARSLVEDRNGVVNNRGFLTLTLDTLLDTIRLLDILGQTKEYSIWRGARSTDAKRMDCPKAYAALLNSVELALMRIVRAFGTDLIKPSLIQLSDAENTKKLAQYLNC